MPSPQILPVVVGVDDVVGAIEGVFVEINACEEGGMAVGCLAGLSVEDVVDDDRFVELPPPTLYVMIPLYIRGENDTPNSLRIPKPL